jgi:hypothetical protein
MPWHVQPRYKGGIDALWPSKAVIGTPKHECSEWSQLVWSEYDSPRRVIRAFNWHHRNRNRNVFIEDTAPVQLAAEPFGGLFSAPILRQLPAANDRRAEFNRLAERWRRETRFSSSSDEKILHPAYQSIIAMGKTAVPLVLEELQARDGHWFWALHFMSGENPVPDDANVSQTRAAWLDWGKKKGFLP